MSYALALASDSRAFTKTWQADEGDTGTTQTLERAEHEQLCRRYIRTRTRQAFPTSGTWADVVGGTIEAGTPPGVEKASNPVDELLGEQLRERELQRNLVFALQLRIGELKGLGAEEDLPWSKASESDFLQFLSSSRSTLKEPGLVLMDNGNLRAVWRNAAGEQVALEFRGYGRIYYVLFARQAGGPQMSRSTGDAALERIAERVASEKFEGADGWLGGM
jgi:hypothetical protein